MNIKSFLSGLLLRIRTLFASLPEDLQQAAQVAITITENLKTVIDDPAVDILTALIPGNLDDAIVQFLRLRLPVIVQQLRLVETPFITTSPAQTVKEAVATIQSAKDDLQHSFLHSLAVMLGRELANLKNGSLSWSDAVYIIEWYYQNKFDRS